MSTVPPGTLIVVDLARARTHDYWLAVSWVRPKPVDLIETMRKIVWHHDAPTPARGRIAEWFVMHEASRHVKVVLEGHGGDELLAGCERNVIPI